MVGAGISGLAAAWEVRRSTPDAELVVLEAASHPGGVIGTSRFAGLAVDEAADAFLARAEDGVRLCRELGLEEDLVAPAVSRAFVYLDGALVPLPAAHFAGVPLDLADLDARLLSPEGLAALRADMARDSQPSGGSPNEPTDCNTDCSIGALVRQRLGDEALERLVGPLIGSINAGDCDRLSLQAAAPALAEAARSHPSLIKSLQASLQARTADEKPAPAFWGLRGGMAKLIDALASQLAPALALEEPAIALHVQPDGAGGQSITRLETPKRSLSCDALVLALPARSGAQLVAPWQPEAATLLAGIETASVAIVTLTYPTATVPAAATGSGFLVPANSECSITACSWASTKWAHLRSSDKSILRVSLGRHGGDDIVRESEETLVAAARAGLATTMGVSAPPVEARVSRWLDAFPQYAVGHLQRTARIEELLEQTGIFCAGSSYRGIGIPACIASGRRAAQRALRWAQTRT